MDFISAISRVSAALDQRGIRYALIGGLAMAARGVQRTTVDLDFLLMLDDLPAMDAILVGQGYVRAFQSEHVSHYTKVGAGLNRIDILHAFRGPSLGMLERAQRLELASGCLLPVLLIEDLVGLKIQALVNNPGRALGDWNDIHRLVRHAAATRGRLDWELIEDYLEIFGLAAELPVLRRHYDETH